MNTITKLIMAAGMTASFAATAMAADVYPADLAKKEPAVAKAFDKLFARYTKDADWIKAYGTAQPVKETKVDGKPGYMITGCKPHACPEAQYVAMISKDGAKAVGALVRNTVQKDGGQPASSQIFWLGNPQDNVRKNIIKTVFQ